jgi:hypothetical protein
MRLRDVHQKDALNQKRGVSETCLRSLSLRNLATGDLTAATLPSIWHQAILFHPFENATAGGCRRRGWLQILEAGHLTVYRT